MEIYWIADIMEMCLIRSKPDNYLKPAQVTSKHKHRCCPWPKWADFVYSLILD